MNFIITTVFWLIGLGVASFTLIPTLIIIVFGIPTTKKLEKLGALKRTNGIIKRYFVTLAILPIVLLVTIAITLLFFSSGLAGLSIGMVMTTLFGLRQIGKNKNNVRDYIETNKQHFAVSTEEATFLIMGP